MSLFTWQETGYQISAPAFTVRDAQAWIEINQQGKDKKLFFTDMEPKPCCMVQTPWGNACRQEFCGQADGLQLRFWVEYGERQPFVCMQAGVANDTGEPVVLHRFGLLDSRSFELPDDCVVTPLMTPEKPFLLREQAKEAVVRDAVMLFPQQGDGVLIGTAGTGTAYCEVSVAADIIRVSVLMDDVLLEEGECRNSEKVLLLSGENTECVEHWAGVIGRLAGARIHRKPVTGWCSWYDQTTKITEKHTREILDVCRENPDIFPFDVIQVDDGYQKYDGEWTANEKFPSGMDKLAEDIRAAGYMAGKWVAPLIVNEKAEGYAEVADAIRQLDNTGSAVLMDDNPFHPLGAAWLDPTHPKGKKFLYHVMRQTAEQGFDYIKIDFNNIGDRFYNRKKTTFEAMRDLYDTYRSGMGEEMYFLSCMTTPTRAVIGFCDALRIGPDSHPSGLRDALECLLRFQYCHKAWWNNDPDVTYLKPMVQGRYLWEIPGGTSQLRTWHNAIALSGGLAMTSEPLEQPDARDSWRMMEILMPPVQEKAAVYNFGRSVSRDKFGFTARRSYGDFAVVMLWNDTDQPKTVEITADEAQLSGEQFAVYSFWDNRVVDICQKRYITPVLAPEESMQLRLTPLDGRPKIVGSNLHLCCGTAEVDECLLRRGEMEIRLTGAGAGSGSIFVYLPGELQEMVVSGMEAAAVKAGGQLYEIRIENRVRGNKADGGKETILLKYTDSGAE